MQGEYREKNKGQIQDFQKEVEERCSHMEQLKRRIPWFFAVGGFVVDPPLAKVGEHVPAIQRWKD